MASDEDTQTTARHLLGPRQAPLCLVSIQLSKYPQSQIDACSTIAFFIHKNSNCATIKQGQIDFHVDLKVIQVISNMLVA